MRKHRPRSGGRCGQSERNASRGSVFRVLQRDADVVRLDIDFLDDRGQFRLEDIAGEADPYRCLEGLLDVVRIVFLIVVAVDIDALDGAAPADDHIDFQVVGAAGSGRMSESRISTETSSTWMLYAPSGVPISVPSAASLIRPLTASFTLSWNTGSLQTSSIKLTLAPQWLLEGQAYLGRIAVHRRWRTSREPVARPGLLARATPPATLTDN
ncbi:hypothetical protein [Burkholderia gladioli]|uniref:hypothetical protein n=1 Tax=Burkholderia gladioli TaxID=28095 RepID=UPI00163F6FDE|nr:hypothetical protein [Burkholderia gladioli]